MSTGRDVEALRAVELAARSAYGRMVAWLAWQWRDVAAAEDALADALESALTVWPRTGLPEHPDRWLLVAAKRNLMKVRRHDAVVADPRVTTVLAVDEAAEEQAMEIPDAPLRLMFVCAHPAIEASVRTALMLQCVLGLPTHRIATLGLMSDAALAKRLVRAKAKIKSAAIRFEVPEPDQWRDRVHAVLEAIYAAYTASAAQTPAQGEACDEPLDHEALFLARLVVQLLPQSAEALGLLALLMFDRARHASRVGSDGVAIPLDRQDPALWDSASIAQGNTLLRHAAGLGGIGAFQIEAAIQSAHLSRSQSGSTPWADIEMLYARLLDLSPTLGAHIGHALALAHARADPGQGLTLLDRLPADAMQHHQPFWASRAYLLDWAQRPYEAAHAYRKAIALTPDAPRRKLLQQRLAS